MDLSEKCFATRLTSSAACLDDLAQIVIPATIKNGIDQVIGIGIAQRMQIFCHGVLPSPLGGSFIVVGLGWAIFESASGASPHPIQIAVMDLVSARSAIARVAAIIYRGREAHLMTRRAVCLRILPP